ncbi:exonuclease SbcCD subunit D [Rubrivirga sp. S365]|uniref:Nuclease SbcCD subunit D n=1 Tax=Rubrivirga litoralis TaxID=3075598 RepID=A0ABU3BT77_9BACT|nr:MULTISPECIES: exonuclease SbcCD subunit D [unclassified Rubrivirga]MDT0632506.1 exonuclease SbcCD subunit D [Rubrivirga sp. F394]MDT7858006.1 exonuclease SbcCD subunit D [Rubrivirga sp. S365]
MKILHCADIHLGYETHGRLDPATGLSTRLLDFRRSFDFMVERAVAEEVDLFLFAGDAYRTADPTPTQQKQFAEALRPVVDAGIPVVMVVGNHDHPVSFGKASSVDIFGVLGGDVEVFAVPTFRAEGHPGGAVQTKAGPLQLVALPWPIRSKILSRDEHRGKTPLEIRDLVEGLYADFVATCAAEADPAVPLVVCAHLTVKGADPSGSERASLIAHEPILTAAQLARPNVDYVALGHIHRFQDRNREAFERGEGPPVVYSSSIERVSFKEADDEKGFVLVDIDAGGVAGQRTAYEFVPTPARRFVSVDADVRGADDPTAALLAQVGRHDIAGAVVRVRYQVDEDQAGAVDAGALRAALADADVVAAIERDVDPAERRQRTVVRRDTSLKDAVERYVDQHEALGTIKDDLVAAALEIEREVDEAA